MKWSADMVVDTGQAAAATDIVPAAGVDRWFAVQALTV